jgi:hypothetical protein
MLWPSPQKKWRSFFGDHPSRRWDVSNDCWWACFQPIRAKLAWSDFFGNLFGFPGVWLTEKGKILLDSSSSWQSAIVHSASLFFRTNFP